MNQFKIKPYDVHQVGNDIYINQESDSKKRDVSYDEEVKHHPIKYGDGFDRNPSQSQTTNLGSFDNSKKQVTSSNKRMYHQFDHASQDDEH